MSILTRGRTELNCYNNAGGVKRVYFTEFIDYPYGVLEGEKGVELTKIPETFIFRYEVSGGTFTQTIEQTDDGEVYRQELSISFTKQDRVTTNELKTLSNISLRYIVEFNDGSLKIGGLYNGAGVTALDHTSGGSKASFNGYNLTISGSELYQAAYIDNLTDVGFIVFVKCKTGSNFILQENSYYLFQDGIDYNLNSCGGVPSANAFTFDRTDIFFDSTIRTFDETKL